MKLVENILTKNPCYTAGRKITVKGLMLHSVGCPQPKASVFINNWNRESYTRACVHGFIDANDGTVYQTLPWDHRGWHGGGASNNTHIGVEMCEPSCITYTGGANFKVAAGKLDEAKACAERTYRVAVELFAMLCGKFGLDPLKDGVILSHAEGYKRGIASGHADPEHLWRQLGTGYTMDGFRKDVRKAMAGDGSAEEKKYYRVRKTWADADSQKGAFAVLDYAKKCADENPGYVVYDWTGAVVYPAEADTVLNGKGMTDADCPFLVRVKVTDLNIRKGAGTNTAKTGKYTGAGVFTIVQVKSGKGSKAGWGKLKSSAGWISLDYCERV